MNFLGYEIKQNSNPLFIAELSCNHCGSLDNLLKLIDLAKRANADIIKIQIYTPDEMTLKKLPKIQNGLWKGKNLYELYQKAQTPLEWVPEIFAYAKSIDIPLFSSVFGDKSLEALEKVNCPAYKIASFEANDYDFIRKANSTGKQLMISTGCISLSEAQTLGPLAITKIGVTFDPIYMHCVSKYPCKDEDSSLSRITKLQRAFGDSKVGYSDHTKGAQAAVLAATLGAKYIEKHFHEPRLGDKSEDASFSMSPMQFKNMVVKTRKAMEMCYDRGTVHSEFKRSLYAITRIRKGEDFNRHNVTSLRPYRGLEPRLFPKILGRRATTTIPAGTPLILDYVDWSN